VQPARPVTRIIGDELGELLSIFADGAVQRITWRV
jgi:hypothetical protein